jgi:diaminopimelate decarboxylase
MPPVAAGELLAMRTAGAYGAVMASTYNGRPLVPEVLVNGEAFAVVSDRSSEDDLLARQRMPDWLEESGHDHIRAAAGDRS